ncbi:2-oxoglutarate dehydrogenase complex dihydrolipoyllysine-residue succinyltransferase [Neoehrlichia mikurensis]|uniref:Dihydrolipoyllysine-residue succinyltransferase component of 2-oxoglutarate dehydrogenase complex n=1 Tax=Neoehrlichia mikurensis TaxID=89586 RepID=A0A9Q9BVY9_9RICK|nr:2-oxoglutarate dehydrogenase complex dihydrolipoyllysine-residue succinyltransferase [Neoehrlichia mikurensis]QXK91634.1 2-oxoglutarate dehydrogenase complex dihydrolipoyllysine-residue succinyltransferase [Neoehrlichia mikurensis]QXK92845.1 2-oxoglutarate dehydrogenase complex dihydrolipoyllysine-residue succinyltransferase [Neoehrlichia mikurensis]QXK93325.1 2-oxoglutarate dehydrogenase complex dihydrolipoyllysine-residue succinyltransferase [Neoehrlichia mikurensis]UTO55733.1 2-oxoglutara
MSSSIEIKADSLGGESILEAPVRVLKNVGSIVSKDEVVFIIETDKTSLEVTSPISGIITKICVMDDDLISKGQLLAVIDRQDDKSLDSKNIEQNDVQEFIEKKHSPAAYRIAEEACINLSDIKGSGHNNRVTKFDALENTGAIKDMTVNDSNLSNNVVSRDSCLKNPNREQRVKMSKIRQVIASRLKESQNTAAILTTFNEVDMKSIMDLRVKYKDSFEKKYNTKLGFMSFFIKAVTLALKEIPVINAEICGNEIIYKNYYDIGIAVGTDKGLVVPVIRDADKMSFSDLEITLLSLSKKARNGKLEVNDMAGATFTITNGGVYGSLLSTPIINPPQSGILGMHAIQNRPVVVNGSIEIRPMMYIALSYDHRIVDGQGAVTFLVHIKQYLEDPNRIYLNV